MALLRARVTLKDGDVVDVDGSQVRLTVRPRARRVSLRIDTLRGEALAIAPSQSRLPTALAFARERSQWIIERLKARPPASPYAPGGSVPLRGVETPLSSAGGAGAARLRPGEGGPEIVSGGEGEAFSRRVERLLRREALADLTARTEAHAQALGLPMPRVAVADPKSRWGSCTPARGTIRYSWRLVLAPPQILDYVAAHEVAHLVHADHSPRFWAVVQRLYGDHRPARAWLRANAAALHAVGRA
jgi:hypothetical protein